MTRVVRGGRGLPSTPLRSFSAGLGFPSPDEIADEIEGMYDYLLDRARLPISYDSAATLMEIGDTFFMRASEIKGKILRWEREGIIDGSRSSKDPYHLLRTGELETFLTACKRTVETGSRRLSVQQYILDAETRGLSAIGGSSSEID